MVNDLQKYKCIVLMFFTCFLLTQGVSAQIQVNAEPELNQLMNRYIANNHKTPMVRAWRIQIITTNDRSVMDEALELFEERYPEIEYSWQHNPPYYQVRIGAYEKKEDLEAFLLKLKEDFPSSIPVQDDIDKKEIISFNE